MVSYGRKYPTEATLDVSSRSDIRNRVKSPPVLQVSFWSLGGQGHSWRTWRWCKTGWNIHQTVCESFIKIWHKEPCQDSTYPPSLLSESRSFLMDLEMVSEGREHPSEASVKVSSRSNMFWLISRRFWVVGGGGGVGWVGLSKNLVKPCANTNRISKLLLD